MPASRRSRFALRMGNVGAANEARLHGPEAIANAKESAKKKRRPKNGVPQPKPAPRYALVLGRKLNGAQSNVVGALVSSGTWVTMDRLKHQVSTGDDVTQAVDKLVGFGIVQRDARGRVALTREAFAFLGGG
ncbi:MAG: hypothetical protein Q7T55_25450 [Solirubrobacteraceae bacterium]|nr:hypothetical protein [Solirubrobacteraceae bacterium]